MDKASANLPQQLKILVILSRVPYPLEKGDKLRAFHQLKELSKWHQVIACCLTDCAVHPDAQRMLAPYCAELHIFTLSRWRIWFNLLFSTLSRKPFQVMYFYQRPAHRGISQVIAQTNPDHIYCQLVRTAEYAKNEHNIPKTLDYQDALSKGMERREQKAHWLLRPVFAAERRRLIAYENIIFEYFEGKTIISDEDRRYIYHPERKDIAIVTNGIDTAYFAPQPEAKPIAELLFTGNMAYPPNIEAAVYLVREILPLLRNDFPSLRIVIAGSSPHRKVRQLASEPGVSVTGWVDDIRSVYASAKIFVAPMQSGTGLQNKLLEAMAMELPCVTSTLANRPLKASPDDVICEARTAAQFAESIALLLRDDALRKSMGIKGRAFVERNFSWSASTGILEATMLAQNKRAGV